MAETTAREVARFWIEEIGQANWYRADEELDDRIRQRFLGAWEDAHSGDMYEWCVNADSVLGFMILTDQFPRNMFRGDRRSFATDVLARTAAKMAIHRRWDMEIPEPERQFFYLPLVHSERLDDQDRAVRLFHERMPERGAVNLLHARAHREVIRKFGRFPFRNEALGRMTLPGEAEFMKSGGYGAMVRELEAAEKASEASA